MKKIVTNFVRLDPDPHLQSCWIRNRIEMNSWIRIRKKLMWIHNPSTGVQCAGPQNTTLGGLISFLTGESELLGEQFYPLDQLKRYRLAIVSVWRSRSKRLPSAPVDKVDELTFALIWIRIRLHVDPADLKLVSNGTLLIKKKSNLTRNESGSTKLLLIKDPIYIRIHTTADH